MAVSRDLLNCACAALICLSLLAGSRSADEADLIAHWKLAGDTKDSAGAGNHGTNHGADLSVLGPDGKAGGAARFDGRSGWIEVPDSPSLQLGTTDFSICVWVNTADELDDVLGDIASKYDPQSRTGFNFSIQNNAGVTSAQSNYRHVHFGIDAGKIEPQWTDCGRPGNSMFVFALCGYQGDLYAGTFEMGAKEAGHVYRYNGGTQ